MKAHCTNKSWEVGFLLKLCDVTFRSGDTEDYYRGMTEDKREKRLSYQFTDIKDTRRYGRGFWQRQATSLWYM